MDLSISYKFMNSEPCFLVTSFLAMNSCNHFILIHVYVSTFVRGGPIILLYIFYRKNVLLASGGLIVAGGMAAYMRSRYCYKKPESFGHYNGLSDLKEQPKKVDRNDKVSMESTPIKRGGPLKIVAAMLLSHMGLRGARNLLVLVAIAV